MVRSCSQARVSGWSAQLAATARNRGLPHADVGVGGGAFAQQRQGARIGGPAPMMASSAIGRRPGSTCVSCSQGKVFGWSAQRATTACTAAFPTSGDLVGGGAFA